MRFSGPMSGPFLFEVNQHNTQCVNFTKSSLIAGATAIFHFEKHPNENGISVSPTTRSPISDGTQSGTNTP